MKELKQSFWDSYSDSLELELVVERVKGIGVLVSWREAGRENTL